MGILYIQSTAVLLLNVFNMSFIYLILVEH